MKEQAFWSTRKQGFIQKPVQRRKTNALIEQNYSCLTRWWTLYRQAGDRMNRNPRVGLELGRLFTQAELSDVRHWSIDVPIGEWNESMSHHAFRWLHDRRSQQK